MMDKCIDRQRRSSSRIGARALPTKRCSLAKRGTEQEGSDNDGVVPESEHGHYQRSGVLWQNEELNKKAVRQWSMYEIAFL